MVKVGHNFKLFNPCSIVIDVSMKRHSSGYVQYAEL